MLGQGLLLWRKTTTSGFVRWFLNTTRRSGQHKAPSRVHERLCFIWLKWLVYYLCRGGYVSGSVCLFVGLSVCQQDYGKSNGLIFKKIGGCSTGQGRAHGIVKRIRLTGRMHKSFFTFVVMAGWDIWPWRNKCSASQNQVCGRKVYPYSHLNVKF